MNATPSPSSSTTPLGFIHRFVPGAAGPDAPVLLLLHGTGGNEHDLIELGQSLMPDAALLSPRGKILENGMPRFFRRLAEGVFDEVDLIHRTGELAEFIEAAVTHYQLNGRKIVAVGYSNGANIAASLLLLRPGILSGAVLLRAMVPLQPESQPDLKGTRVFLSSGQFDPIIPAANSAKLDEMLKQGGADVTLLWNDAGHQLTSSELEEAKSWLAAL